MYQFHDDIHHCDVNGIGFVGFKWCDSSDFHGFNAVLAMIQATTKKSYYVYIRWVVFLIERARDAYLESLYPNFRDGEESSVFAMNQMSAHSKPHCLQKCYQNNSCSAYDF